MKPILTLDFDGVIHSYGSGWKGASVIPDPPVPGALQFIVRALDEFTVCIHSSRSHQWGGRRAMKRYLREQIIAVGLGDTTPNWLLDGIANNHSMEPWQQEVEALADRVVKAIRWPLFKPASKVSIDDRALTFDGTWPDLADIHSFQPWNKKARASYGPGRGW